MSKPALRPLYSWRSAICDSTLPADVRHVALTISLHMNERGGSCFPGLDTLRAETGRGKSTIIAAIKVLTESGWLKRTKEGGGRGRPSGYEASTPKELSSLETESRTESPPKLSWEPPQTVLGASTNCPAAGLEDVKRRGRKAEDVKLEPRADARADFVAPFVDGYRQTHKGADPTTRARKAFGSWAKEAHEKDRKDADLIHAVAKRCGSQGYASAGWFTKVLGELEGGTSPNLSRAAVGDYRDEDYSGDWK